MCSDTRLGEKVNLWREAEGNPLGAEAAEAVPRYEGLHFFRSPNEVRGERGFPKEPLVPTEALSRSREASRRSAATPSLT
jgi:hypothetical protein